MSLPPLLFFHLLANRRLEPGAIELEVGSGDVEALLPLLLDEEFSLFAEDFPCLIGDTLSKRLSPALAVTAAEVGCQLVKGECAYRTDEQTRPAIPSVAEWVAGNWYVAPPAKLSGTQAASRALSLKLLQRVAEDADTFEIESIFRQDPVLAYHLLRLVNSLGAGVGRAISSFSQAILILGRQQLKRWLNLMLFAACRDDYRSPMLLARVAIRARTMELLSKAGGLDRSLQDQAFMAGMFSLLGVLFGSPLNDILGPLKLSDSLTSAINRYEGELGRLLQAVMAAERADEGELLVLLEGLDVSTDDFNHLNLAAHQWMLGVIHEKQDPADA